MCRETIDSPTPRRDVHKRARRSPKDSRDEGHHRLSPHTKSSAQIDPGTEIRKQGTTRKKTRFSGNDPTSTAKAADRAPDEECTRLKPLRVRKTIQNRRINLSATDSDLCNRRRRHISGEVSPQQRCHCSSILVSPRKDVGAVTAEYTGY